MLDKSLFCMYIIDMERGNNMKPQGKSLVELAQMNEWSIQEIADFFGVSRAMIYLVVDNKRWNEEARSFEMKTSNSYREFTSTNKPTRMTTQQINQIQDRLDEISMLMRE